MSEAVLPPKKSKAAREAPQENGHESEVSIEEVNVFKVTVVEGKRERKVPAEIQKLTEWIDENLEEKEGVTFKLGDIYNAYVEALVDFGTTGVEQTLFYKTIKDQFPKGFGIKKDSPHHDVIKERKKRPKSEKPKAPSLTIKMKDIIARIIQELGNPKKGIRFQTLKMHIAAKYPALRVDVRPGILKNTLMRGAYYGSVEQVKGVGAAGYYRLPGPELNPDGTEKVEEPKIKVEAADDDEKGNEDKDKEMDKDGKEKEKEGEGSGENEKQEKPKPKRKKKQYVPKKRIIIHSDPEKVEDTFPLAMTYMSEPKEASSRSIKNYILAHYKDVLNSDRFKKALSDGEEKGFWDCVRGDGLNGSYQLSIEDFDPTDDKDLFGMIVNAITACTEPKQCSSRALKTYITEYHPKFNIVEKPNLFKKALERACKNQDIIQISGIGSSGSFQLGKVFCPNPVILAGQDTDSDYDAISGSDGDIDTDDETTEYAQGFSIKQFQDAYVPRATKRRGKQRAAASKKIDTLQYTNQPVKRKSTSSRMKPKATKRKTMYKDDSDDTSSSEEESSSEENSSDEPTRVEKYVPRGTKSRGGGRGPVKTKAQTKARPAPKKRNRKMAVKDMHSSEEDVSEEEVKGKAKAKPTPKGKGRRKPAEKYSEEEASSEEEVKPKAKARSTPKARGGRKAAKSSSEEEAVSEEEVKTKSKAKGRSTPKARGGRKAAAVSSEDEASSEEEVKTKAKSKGRSTPKARGGRKAAEVSSEDEAVSEEEIKAKAKAKGRSTPKARGGRKAAEMSSEDEASSVEEVKTKTKAKAKPTPKSKGRYKAAVSYSEEELKEEPSSEEESPPPKKRRGPPEETASPKTKGKGHSKSAKQQTKAAETSEEEREEEDVSMVKSEGEESEEEARAPKGKPSPKKAASKGRKKGKGRRK